MANLDEEETYHTILPRENYEEMVEKYKSEENEIAYKKALDTAVTALMHITAHYHWDRYPDGATARQMNIIAENSLATVKGIFK